MVVSHPMADGGLLVSMDGRSHVVYSQEQVRYRGVIWRLGVGAVGAGADVVGAQASGLRLLIDGKTCVFSEEYDPSIVRVAMPGTQTHITIPKTKRDTRRGTWTHRAASGSGDQGRHFFFRIRTGSERIPLRCPGGHSASLRGAPGAAIR